MGIIVFLKVCMISMVQDTYLSLFKGFCFLNFGVTWAMDCSTEMSSVMKGAKVM